MRAIFIAVGSEMLELDRIDTNSLYAVRRLREKGILTDIKLVVGDHVDQLSWLVKKACQRAQLVVICGGLGPTEDDITREAVSTALKRSLVYREDLAAAVRELFRQRGLNMPDINTRQAFIVEGAEVLENPFGTAFGQWIDTSTAKIVLLPGPPNEMIPMFDRVLAERIAPLCNYFIYSRMLKMAGIGESEADAAAADIYRAYRNPAVTILAAPGGIELHLLGRSRNSVDEARRLTDELAEKLKERLKQYIFAEDETSFEEYLVGELRRRGLTLAVAESCSGGALGHRITNVPGSSEVFLGGVIAYANEMKHSLLHVRPETVKRFGAVSEQTAQEMAAGARRISGAALGLAITGIAGPGGATPGKPVGLVHTAVCGEKGALKTYRVFGGDRESIKIRSAYLALTLLRQYLNTHE